MSNKITITYLNREGGGFAERHTLDAGTTVAQFLETRGINADNCTIRIVRTRPPCMFGLWLPRGI